MVESVSVQSDNARWTARKRQADCSHFDVLLDGETVGTVSWSQLGEHSMHNALVAIAAARHAGVPVSQAIDALGEFLGVKRRMEIRGEVNGVTVYDDFAHHPTAIATTLQGLRRRVGDARILLVMEPRSNTMRMGTHRDCLADSMQAATSIWLLQPTEMDWSLSDEMKSSKAPVAIHDSVDAITAAVGEYAQPGDHVLVMSNGAFGGIHEKILSVLQHR